MVSVQYIPETGDGQERTKKLKTTVAVVCTSVRILKIRKMVNKMGGYVKLKWVYFPHSKMEARGEDHILLFCYLLNRDYRDTPN